MNIKKILVTGLTVATLLGASGSLSTAYAWSEHYQNSSWTYFSDYYWWSGRKSSNSNYYHRYENHYSRASLGWADSGQRHAGPRQWSYAKAENTDNYKSHMWYYAPYI